MENKKDAAVWKDLNEYQRQENQNLNTIKIFKNL